MENLIILDSELQKKNEAYYQSLNGGSQVVYTNYESSLIRKVRNFKYIGSALYHLLMWKKSYDYARKFKDVTILEVADGFVLIETDEKEKVLINLDFIRIIVEAKEGALPPVFVPHDL